MDLSDFFKSPAEKKIASALQAAGRSVSSGIDPDRAASKAAMDFGLTPPMAERLVECLNMAITRSHVMGGGGGEGFPLADKGKVARAAFAEIGGSGPPDEGGAPDWWDAMASGHRKSASQEGDDCELYALLSGAPMTSRGGKSASEGDPGLSRPIGELCEAVRGMQDMDRRKRAALAAEATRYAMEAEAVAGRIISKYSLSENMGKFASFCADCEAAMGDSCMPFLAVVAEHGNFPPPAAAERKFASRYDASPAANISRPSGDVALAAEGVRLVGKIAEAEAKLEAFEGEADGWADDFWAGVRKLASPGAPPSKPAPPANSGVVDKINAKGTELASAFISPYGSIVRQVGEIAKPHLDNMGKAMEANDAANRYIGPTQSDVDEIDNMRRAAILSNIIKGDEILSRQDPRAVGMAYENLVQLAPSVALNPAVARSILRATVQGQGMEPYTAADIVKLDRLVGAPADPAKASKEQI